MDRNLGMQEPLLGDSPARHGEAEFRGDDGTTSSPFVGDEDAEPLPVSRGLDLSGWEDGRCIGSEQQEKPADEWKFKYKAFLTEEMLAASQRFSDGRRGYYRKQREAIAGFEEVDDISASPNEPEEDIKEQKRENFAINVSNMCNVLLLIMKGFAAVESGSLAIVASTLDSLLDILAGLVLWLTRVAMRDKDPYKYPIGKLRVQPVGIIVFACIMATLGLQVLVTGVQQLVQGGSSAALMGSQERIYTLLVMGGVIMLKLGLFLYCRTFENEIVQAYAQDHYFDIITNVVGLTAALLARVTWWLDPVGAIILAMYTITVWSRTILEHAASLVGKSASPEFLQKVTYMAFNHDQHIKQIRTVRGYTVGTFFFVEVDLEFPETLPLADARRISQSLQGKLEMLPEVERAFVHPYASFHRPDHVRAEPRPFLHSHTTLEISDIIRADPSGPGPMDCS